MTMDFRQSDDVTIASGGGTAVFTLVPARPLALDKLTVWATIGAGGAVPSGGSLTFQPKVSGKNFGSSTVITAGTKVADVVFSSAGTDNLIPNGLAFTIGITNASSADVTVTFLAAGLGGSI